MPNHVLNEVRLHGVPLEACRALIAGEDRAIDFSVLVPLPINYWAGSVGRHHEEAFPGTHLEAARTEWGTKWNAYGLDEGRRYVSVSEADGDTILTFQTAWAPPRGWIVALFNTLKCDITSKWLDEGRVNAYAETYRFAGLSDFKVEGWKTEEIAEGSTEHRRLHHLLWGVEKFEDEDESN